MPLTGHAGCLSLMMGMRKAIGGWLGIATRAVEVRVRSLGRQGMQVILHALILSRSLPIS
jgi:hypothetical protein